MAQLILLRGAKQLLTLRGPQGVRRGAALQDLGIIEDGSVLIRDGLIAAVGSTRRLENLKEARDALEIQVNGRVVMPGFIDASLNLSQRGAVQRRRRTAEFYDDSLALLRACLLHGTLAADIKATADADDLHSDISVLRKLASIGSNPVRMVRTWRVTQASPSEEDDFRPTLDVLLRRKLIQSIELSEVSEGRVDQQIFEAARDAHVGVKLFWDGSSQEELASLLDRFRPRAVSCHSHVAVGESRALAQSDSIGVFTTGTNVFEGPVAKSARQFVDAGGAIALSSGYDSSSAATFSMQMSVALAVVRLGLTAEEAFSAATINAAHAMGCAHLTGSLEYGKRADVLVLNVGDYREVPQQFGINHVEMAIRDGNIVLNRTRWRAAPI